MLEIVLFFLLFLSVDTSSLTLTAELNGNNGVVCSIEMFLGGKGAMQSHLELHSWCRPLCPLWYHASFSWAASLEGEPGLHVSYPSCI